MGLFLFIIYPMIVYYFYNSKLNGLMFRVKLLSIVGLFGFIFSLFLVGNVLNLNRSTKDLYFFIIVVVYLFTFILLYGNSIYIRLNNLSKLNISINLLRDTILNFFIGIVLIFSVFYLLEESKLSSNFGDNSFFNPFYLFLAFTIIFGVIFNGFEYIVSRILNSKINNEKKFLDIKKSIKKELRKEILEELSSK